MAGDPHFSSVLLLLHCDGADGSTTFTDHSSYGRTATVVGNAQVDTAAAKYGTGSILFDGTGDKITFPDSTDWDWGTGDFTIEFWAYNFTSSGNKVIIGQIADGGAGSNGWALFTGASGAVVFAATTGVGSWNVASAGAGAGMNLTGATWKHFAMCRASGTYYFFLNGTQTATGSMTGNITGSALALCIGDGTSAANALSGQMDDIRITKGVARYTSDFTPSIIPFPNRGLNAVGPAHHYRMRRAA